MDTLRNALLTPVDLSTRKGRREFDRRLTRLHRKVEHQIQTREGALDVLDTLLRTVEGMPDDRRLVNVINGFFGILNLALSALPRDTDESRFILQSLTRRVFEGRRLERSLIFTWCIHCLIEDPSRRLERMIDTNLPRRAAMRRRMDVGRVLLDLTFDNGDEADVELLPPTLPVEWWLPRLEPDGTHLQSALRWIRDRFADAPSDPHVIWDTFRHEQRFPIGDYDRVLLPLEGENVLAHFRNLGDGSVHAELCAQEERLACTLTSEGELQEPTIPPTLMQEVTPALRTLLRRGMLAGLDAEMRSALQVVFADALHALTTTTQLHLRTPRGSNPHSDAPRPLHPHLADWIWQIRQWVPRSVSQQRREGGGQGGGQRRPPEFHRVRMHRMRVVRGTPDPEKVQVAYEKGMILPPGCTLVGAHDRGVRIPEQSTALTPAVIHIQGRSH
jgi:hypothetical protein